MSLESDIAVGASQPFIETELGFTAYVRDPDNAAMPSDVEPRRMAIYAELLFNNIAEQLSTNFPVLKAITEPSRWEAMVRDFMVRHRCSTPLFTEIGQEFLTFLRETRVDHPDDPPFMLELAHYEWVDLAVYIDDVTVDREGVDPNGDLLSGRPVVSPLAWPLAYQFDVQHISPDYLPDSAPEQPTYLVVYRDREDAVNFSEITPVTYRLLELLEADQSLSGEVAARQIADELQHPDPQVVVSGARELLERLREREIILGSRPV